MRHTFRLMGGAFIIASLFLSCQEDSAVSEKLVSKAVLDQISALGFSNENVQKIDEGYLVEGDIILTEENLQDHAEHTILRIAETEQYRTTNLVTGLPRTVTVSMDSHLTGTPGYSAALDIALARYAAEGLELSFQRLSSGTGQIHFKRQGGNFLASAGFPTSGGNPYSTIKINSNAIGSGTSSTFQNYCATILAHEMGHCIGMRHTDYANRSVSCGGSAYNEGQSSVGAIHIPGTATGPNDPGSWMWACIGSDVDRPFNPNDKVALDYLYDIQ